MRRLLLMLMFAGCGVDDGKAAACAESHRACEGTLSVVCRQDDRFCEGEANAAMRSPLLVYCAEQYEACLKRD